MAWIELVTLVALLQYLAFSVLVGRARGRYGVAAPATTGHEGFERVYRVQMNTQELLVLFLPALWLAARHMPPMWVSAIGMVFIIGRLLYYRAYTTEPRTRTLGFVLSMTPVITLMVMALMGLARNALGAGL